MSESNRFYKVMQEIDEVFERSKQHNRRLTMKELIHVLDLSETADDYLRVNFNADDVWNLLLFIRSKCLLAESMFKTWLGEYLIEDGGELDAATGLAAAGRGICDVRKKTDKWLKVLEDRYDEVFGSVSHYGILKVDDDDEDSFIERHTSDGRSGQRKATPRIRHDPTRGDSIGGSCCEGDLS